ncbi:MAG TPA: hypothetical protein VE988_11650 [Gemmataceae bacterium]|nr:hypothetical protein [Gemmataceae bacterium]
MQSTIKNSALDRIFDSIGRVLTPDVARKLIDLRADAKTQARIDRLARKANEGKMTEDERSEYAAIVSAIDFVAVLQSKARTLLAHSTAK